MSQLLDDAIAIPSTDYRVGIDPLLGLFPGAGDGLSVLFSVYIVLESMRFGLPKETLVRMVINLVLDSAVGSVPLLGDVFDVVWKANRQNLQLLEAHIERPKPQTLSDRIFVFTVAALLLLVALGAIAVVVGVVKGVIWLLSQ